MYLPKVYASFSQDYPQVLKSYQQLGETCKNAGPLGSDVQHLIKLGIAIGTNSRGAVMSHTRKALEAGIPPDEIRHTALLAITTTGLPNMMAAMGWVNEVLTEEG